MAPKVLFDGTVGVSYRFIYLDSGVGGWDQDLDVRAGQRNGLAGAAQPGFVLLTTGTHSGALPLRIELHRREPRLDERWDEIVEVSCDLRGRRLLVSTFDDALDRLKVRRNGPHRVRYSAFRFEDEDERDDDETALDRYLVQLWPAPMAPDSILKQTTGSAAYWHAEAGGPVEPDPTPHEQALAELAEHEAHLARERAFEHQQSLWPWGGREPSRRLRELDPRAIALAGQHRDLVDVVEALAPARQRQVALEVARRACAGDHDSPVDWTPALEALGRGGSLPAPFDDQDALDALMFGPARQVSFEGSFTRVAEVGRVPRPRIHTGVSAAAAVRGASDPDPFAAALRAIGAASWSAPDEDAFFAEVEALVR